MKKLGLLSLLVIFSLSAFAQKQKIIALSNYDYKKIHFGMALDFGQYNLINDFNDSFYQNNDILSIETDSDVGIGVSFILPDLRINDRLNLRHVLTVKTIQRKINYRFSPDFDGPLNETKSVESWFVESGFHLKYRADRINNYRAFLFFGPNIGIDMASEKDVKDEEIFKLNRNNIALEIGAGCDFYFEYFKFAPQIKYSHGLTNLIVDDGTIFTSPLDGFYSRGFQISFTFE
ncbi:MAG: porin family protein [Flavobacteriales bacterium]|nr:porin family protein [Flavobacteriales bacterium]